MNTTLKTIEIDIYSPTSYEVIKAQQGDHNARSIELILFDQGKPYEITDNITLQFTGYRGNGSAFFKNNCVFAEGNRIIITLTNDILYYAGTIEAKIVLYDTPNRSVLSTVPFQIVCEKTPCHEGCLTQNENTIITDLIFQVEEFSESAAETIRQSEENADNAANSAASAADSAKEALNSKNDAESSKFAAAESETNAAASADTASVKAAESADNAKTARSYACGDTNLRPDESADNAKYYYMQSKEIYDDFTQSGNVVGVKGNAQTEYQSGFVNLTAEQIGALPNTMKTTISNSYNRANAAYGQANMAYNRANAAYDQASLSYSIINSDSLCLGNNASYPGWHTTAVGGSAIAICNGATAYGHSANAASSDSTALGYYAYVDINAHSSTAIGCLANASGNYSVAIGSNAQALTDNSTALGCSAYANNYRSSAFGYSAKANGESSIALGYYANAQSNYSVALGSGANASAYSTALGYNANARGTLSVALGLYAKSNYCSTALGSYANAGSNYSTALGYYANVSSPNSTALGSYANVPTTSANTIQLGSSSTLSTLSCRVDLSVTSDERDKADITEMEDGALEFLNKIHAIRYVLNHRELYIDDKNLSEEEREKKEKFGLCEYDRKAHTNGTKKGTRIRAGVSAQEVQAALKEVYGDSSYANLINDNLFDLNPNDIPDNVENQLTANYTGFIPFLIKAVQELSRQTDENTAAILALTSQNQPEETQQNSETDLQFQTETIQSETGAEKSQPEIEIPKPKEEAKNE